ncbi:MAG: DegQ family serine endoprotease [Bryobacterales bacterium]|nr:DegQ family serine endoprotease [Bryobacterales bacterium]
MRIRVFRNWKLTTAAAALFALGALGGAALTAAHSKPNVEVKLSTAAPPKAGFGDVVERNLPAVVSITMTKSASPQLSRNDIPPELAPFFGRMPQQQPRKARGAGSGVIVSPDGYLLTNSHVVNKASQIKVLLSDRREFTARLIGEDTKTDLAVLKIDATNLPTVTFADSARVRVGDYSLAIGNPFGVGQTVTMGIVSATARGGLGIEEYEDFIQTDAAINPGNSGGALVNANGDLIGINTAILSPTGGNNGVGFAIPSNLARHVMDQLISHGKVTRAFLGVTLQPLTPELATAMNIPGNFGAVIADVTPGSPAARAGLKSGDVITAMNGKKVNDWVQLKLMVGNSAPNTEAKFTLIRDAREQTIAVTLDELTDRKIAANRPGETNEDAALEGVEVANLTPRTRRQLDLPPTAEGVVITAIDPSSKAAEAGLRQGDLIRQVNRKPVANVTDLDDQLRSANSKDVLLQINREGANLFVVLPAEG